MRNDAVERKLKVSFCDYLVTARHLNRSRDYRIYQAYCYFGEVFVLLAGFGIANPVMAFLSGGQPSPESGKGYAPTVASFLSGTKFGVIALAMLVAWGLVKFYIRHEDLEKRCNLVSSYRRQCQQIEVELLSKVLPQTDPMPDLLQLQAKLSDLVGRNVAEGSIEDCGIDQRFKAEFDEYLKRLVDRFSDFWSPAPSLDRLKPQSGGGIHDATAN